MDFSEIESRTKCILRAIEDDDVSEVRNASTELIKAAALTQGPAEIKLAMIGYSISKIMGKGHYRRNHLKWNDFTLDMEEGLRRVVSLCGKSDGAALIKHLDKMFSDIRKLDESFGRYIDKITDKAMVKTASTLYALGLSVKSAASLTGASEWELLPYAGKTKVVDQDTTMDIAFRLKYARRILG